LAQTGKDFLSESARVEKLGAASAAKNSTWSGFTKKLEPNFKVVSPACRQAGRPPAAASLPLFFARAILTFRKTKKSLSF